MLLAVDAAAAVTPLAFARPTQVGDLELYNRVEPLAETFLRVVREGWHGLLALLF